MADNLSSNSFVFGLHEIEKSNLNIAGGKGANLGELQKIEGVYVPDGFCISTMAFKRIIGDSTEISDLIDQLSRIHFDDRDKLSEVAEKIRAAIEARSIPQDAHTEIRRELSSAGDKHAYAVRSSATAEDLPTASFAGQQDSYLNIIGEEAILKHISKCWASLFTERAIVYRIKNGFDHRKVQLAVIVQKMVFSHAAGIVFTADPITGNRKVLSIDAGFGLGEAMVSGLVNPDVYKVSNNAIIDKKISTKKVGIYPLQNGGTQEQKIETAQQDTQVLTDAQIVQLSEIAKNIEEHFGRPQDIEWCLVDNTFYIVQSRPITTLFPIPEVNDQLNHVYVSVGHQQMMTDAMKPLGLSFFLLTTLAPMRTAGGRLFVDVTKQLSSAGTREIVINALGQSDPLIKDALLNIVGRKDFIELSPDDNQTQVTENAKKEVPTSLTTPPIEHDPKIVSDLIKASQQSLEELKHNIRSKSGSALFDFILEDLSKLKQLLFSPQSLGVIIAAMNASAWINEKMAAWLGEKSVADTIAQSVDNNVTSEMGLELLDVADVIREHPEVVAYLEQTNEDNFLDGLIHVQGGKESRNTIEAFLDKYGVRCSGEIDITKSRWIEKPALLISTILTNVKNCEPHASAKKFAQGLQEASKKERDLLSRLAQLPDGDQKAGETKRMINLIRNFSGYREYPKYGKVSRYFVYRTALLKEAERLVQQNVIQDKEDIYYLSYEELRDVVTNHRLDYQIIDERKDAFKVFEKLSPPRVITSDGEIIIGKYKLGNLPANALAGLAVSAGVIEGRARVILNMEDAIIEDGDILVTTFTDPSWTPLFVSIKGLVTEVGGLMTHGAVIAREYGLPAVVGVEDATKLIKDGQRIRIHGTEGYVEML